MLRADPLDAVAETAGGRIMPAGEHAIEQAKERYGIDLVLWDLVNIRDKIESGKSLLMGTDPNRPTQTHIVTYRDTEMQVIFDPKSRCVVTFYEKGWKLGRGGYNLRKNGKRKRLRGKRKGKRND